MKKEDMLIPADEQISIGLLNANIHFLTGEINEESIRRTIEWIVYENLSTNNDKPLSLYINSAGGDLNEAFGLIDIMRNSNRVIRTFGIGSVCSAAFLIFASGTKGHRYIAQNTSIMCHQYATEMNGKYHDMKAFVRESELTNTRMLTVLQECTGLEPRSVKTKLIPPSDVWFTAEEIVELGVADNIF